MSWITMRAVSPELLNYKVYLRGSRMIALMHGEGQFFACEREIF